MILKDQQPIHQDQEITQLYDDKLKTYFAYLRKTPSPSCFNKETLQRSCQDITIMAVSKQVALTPAFSAYKRQYYFGNLNLAVENLEGYVGDVLTIQSTGGEIQVEPGSLNVIREITHAAHVNFIEPPIKIEGEYGYECLPLKIPPKELFIEPSSLTPPSTGISEDPKYEIQQYVQVIASAVYLTAPFLNALIESKQYSPAVINYLQKQFESVYKCGQTSLTGLTLQLIKACLDPDQGEIIKAAPQLLRYWTEMIAKLPPEQKFEIMDNHDFPPNNILSAPDGSIVVAGRESVLGVQFSQNPTYDIDVMLPEETKPTNLEAILINMYIPTNEVQTIQAAMAQQTETDPNSPAVLIAIEGHSNETTCFHQYVGNPQQLRLVQEGITFWNDYNKIRLGLNSSGDIIQRNARKSFAYCKTHDLAYWEDVSGIDETTEQKNPNDPKVIRLCNNKFHKPYLYTLEEPVVNTKQHLSYY